MTRAGRHFIVVVRPQEPLISYLRLGRSCRGIQLLYARF
jgi:hypothetical protein